MTLRLTFPLLSLLLMILSTPVPTADAQAGDASTGKTRPARSGTQRLAGEPARPRQPPDLPEPRSASRPPLALEHKYDPYRGQTDIILPWSPVGGNTGLADMKFMVNYAYDGEWWYANHLNDVSFLFGMLTKERVCGESCELTLILDGYRWRRTVEGNATPLSDGYMSETISFWMRPEVFQRIAAAKKIEVEIGRVTCQLTEAQLTGMRQIVPYLKIRLLP